MSGSKLTVTAGGVAAVAAAVWVITTSEAPPARDPSRPLRRIPLSQERERGKIEGVCVLSPTGEDPVRGTLLFKPHGTQVEVTGTIEGLEPGRYRFEVSEFGDLRSPDGGSVGRAFFSEGVPDAPLLEDPAADFADPLGPTSFVADANGVGRVSGVSRVHTLYGPDTIIGRAVAVYEDVPQPSEAECVAVGVIGRAGSVPPPSSEPTPVTPLTSHGGSPKVEC